MVWVNGGASRTSSPQWRKIRRRLIAEDNRCALCGADGREVLLEADHIVPVAQGGDDSLGNARLLCQPCHRPKTAREAAYGRHGRRTRAPRQHPGLI
ncbi:HNH endonuclease [Gordonia tangerina]|uniref:HNH endonuclease n=1 Tax=Gordonia tangerina TaxID=2911060 RepID=UPI001F25E38B|nr:HNH endonuclease signature motif containing protein [Gordonia tangerina]